MKDFAEALAFVKGGVGKTDIIPAFSFFRICDGFIISSNGKMSLGHPIDLDLDITPKASLFLKALSALPKDKPVSIDVTATGRLALRAGGFKAFVPLLSDCPQGVFNRPDQDSEKFSLNIIDVLKDVLPFVSHDSTRAWSQAIKFNGNFAYATNNQIVVKRVLDRPASCEFVISLEAAKELVRIGKEPTNLSYNERSATFSYANGAWLTFQLLNELWPERLVEVAGTTSDKLVDFPTGFSDNLKRLKPFLSANANVYISEKNIATAKDETVGARAELDYAIGEGIFHYDTLCKVAACATKVDFWAKPAIFSAPLISGVAMHMPDKN